MNLSSRWRIAFYLAVMFLAGVAAGGFIGFKAGRHILFTPPSPEGMAEREVRELETKLALTPAQTQKITAIIRDSMAEFGATLSQQIANTYSNTNLRIATELTPEQKVKFEALQREWEESLHLQSGEAPAGSKKSL
jgi:hypothetical protein